MPVSNEIAVDQINCAKSSCCFHEIVKTECGPGRGAEGNVLVARCMDDITSHLASCHSFKCSKVIENELILARAGMRGLSELKGQSAHGTNTK